MTRILQTLAARNQEKGAILQLVRLFDCSSNNVHVCALEMTLLSGIPIQGSDHTVAL